MGGCLILFMCNFIITNDNSCNLINVEHILKSDGMFRQIKNLFGFNILIFGDQSSIEYNETEEIFCIFNGSLFEEEKNIILKYKTYGEHFTKNLNGEYSFVLVDKKNNKFIASADIFGTHPLYYTINNSNIFVSNYYSALEFLGLSFYFRIFENNYFIYNIKNEDLNIFTVHDFKNIEIKSSLVDWEKAFENSVLKKIKDANNITLLLSDGIDSGSIACCLQKYNIKFNAVSLLTDNNCPNDIFYWRHGKTTNKFTKNSNLGNVSVDSLILEMNDLKLCECKCIFDKKNDRFNQKKQFYEEEFFDDNNIGIMLSCFLSKYMKTIKSDLLLTGHGAIFSDKNINRNLNWTNHLRSCNYDNPVAIKQVCDPHQIKVRFPLLDKDLFQETLWLNKNKYSQYKQHVQIYLDNNKYPYCFYDKNNNKIINIRGLTN